MQPVSIGLTIVSMLLSACLMTTTPARDQPVMPNAASIEKLLRDTLANDGTDTPGLFPYEDAVLMEFRLVDLEQVSSSRWQAETELLFDYGPAPAWVMGLERIRRGRYKLRLDQQDARLLLTRFTPVGTVQPLLDDA